MFQKRAKKADRSLLPSSLLSVATLFMALIAASAAVNWLWLSASKVEVHAAAAAKLDNSAADVDASC